MSPVYFVCLKHKVFHHTTYKCYKNNLLQSATIKNCYKSCLFCVSIPLFKCYKNNMLQAIVRKSYLLKYKKEIFSNCWIYFWYPKLISSSTRERFYWGGVTNFNQCEARKHCFVASHSREFVTPFSPIVLATSVYL